MLIYILEIGVYMMSDFGYRLREEREKQGYTLGDVEEETKIRKMYLQALEDENFAVLPPRVYATGFVKRYARFLRLNGEELTAEFKEIAYGNELIEEIERQSNTKSYRDNPKISYRNFFVALIFLALVIWVGNSFLIPFFTGQLVEHEQPGIESPNVQLPPEPTVDDNTAEVEENLSTVLEVKVLELCWLSVITDGTEEYSGNLEAGQYKKFEAKESIKIMAGNAGGVELILNGKKLLPIGVGAQVKTIEYFTDGRIVEHK